MQKHTHLKTPAQRRAKARNVRALDRLDESPKLTMREIADHHGISRAQAFKLIAELEAWEASATFQDEADAVMAQTPGEYHPFLWLLVSGRMLYAYTQGEVTNSVFGPAADGHNEPDLLLR